MKATTFLWAEMGLKQFAKGFAAEKRMIAAAAEGPTRERCPPRRSSDRRTAPKIVLSAGGRSAGRELGRCPRPLPRRHRRMGRRSNAKPAGVRLHNLGSLLRRTPQLSVVRRVLSDRRRVWGSCGGPQGLMRISHVGLFDSRFSPLF